MIISLHLRHFKIYKGIHFIPLSNGENFCSLIGENGTGKSSILEAVDFILNKKDIKDWPINNDAKYKGGVKGSNSPFIAPTFLMKKSSMRQTTDDEIAQFTKAQKLSDYLWSTTFKTTSKTSEEFYEHRDNLKAKYNPDEYLLVMVGKRPYEHGIYLGSFQNDLGFNNEEEKHDEAAFQNHFEGFYDYIISHYAYLYIPVETDAHLYTKLETLDMQKLMDKNIHKEIEKAITKKTLTEINAELNKFVGDIEKTLESYEYKGKSKNSLTMPDLVSKIIEAYFSIKVLNKKSKDSRLVAVYNLSSGEKRKALIDVAYSFLVRNQERDKQIILAVDEPDASLHISACYQQFSRLYELGKLGHQIIITTHWYGYLPIISEGSATSIKKAAANEVDITFFDLYNYRERITQDRRKIKGPLPYDISLKSHNDLIQSITYSLLGDSTHNWLICEGLSEKIYFEYMFQDKIELNNLKILPVGGFKEVKKIYESLISPMNDPDYSIKGTVFCLIDTDTEALKVDVKSSKNLFFKRLLNNDKTGTTLVNIDNPTNTPPTEIEDCLDAKVFYKTLQHFGEIDDDINQILQSTEFNKEAKFSFDCLDLKKSEQKKIKDFFDKNLGENKLTFAKKYVEIAQEEAFSQLPELSWITEIKSSIKEEIKKESREKSDSKGNSAKAINDQLANPTSPESTDIQQDEFDDADEVEQEDFEEAEEVEEDDFDEAGSEDDFEDDVILSPKGIEEV